MGGRTQLEIEGINAFYAVDKISRAGITVFSVRKLRENAISLEVESKDTAKVFAILQSSCYNIIKKNFRGFTRLRKLCLRSAGILAGALIFALSVALSQTRVLAIDVVGSGACYEAEVLRILGAGGVEPYKPMPQDTALLTAEILSLPRVSFCSFRKSGGILTVEVEVSDENALLYGQPLLSPATGTVTELITVRGTPCVQVGDEVREGDVIVRNSALYGETERGVIVIARVKIAFPVTAEYGGTQEEAAAQALLDYGELEIGRMEQTDSGWKIAGTAYAAASANLD